MLPPAHDGAVHESLEEGTAGCLMLGPTFYKATALGCCVDTNTGGTTL